MAEIGLHALYKIIIHVNAMMELAQQKNISHLEGHLQDGRVVRDVSTVHDHGAVRSREKLRDDASLVVLDICLLELTSFFV